MSQGIEKSAATEAIRLASSAWRWRQEAIALLAAGDVAGAERAIERATLAEAAVAQLADSIIENETKGSHK